MSRWNDAIPDRKWVEHFRATSPALKKNHLGNLEAHKTSENEEQEIFGNSVWRIEVTICRMSFYKRNQ